MHKVLDDSRQFAAELLWFLNKASAILVNCVTHTVCTSCVLGMLGDRCDCSTLRRVKAISLAHVQMKPRFCVHQLDRNLSAL